MRPNRCSIKSEKCFVRFKGHFQTHSMNENEPIVKINSFFFFFFFFQWWSLTWLHRKASKKNVCIRANHLVFKWIESRTPSNVVSVFVCLIIHFICRCTWSVYTFTINLISWCWVSDVICLSIFFFYAPAKRTHFISCVTRNTLIYIACFYLLNSQHTTILKLKSFFSAIKWRLQQQHTYNSTIFITLHFHFTFSM